METLEIEVAVFDTSHRPIQGAQVIAKQGEDIVLTDRSGRCLINLYNNYFVVRKDGFINQECYHDLGGLLRYEQVTLVYKDPFLINYDQPYDKENSPINDGIQTGDGENNDPPDGGGGGNPLPLEPKVFGYVTDKMGNALIGANVYQTNPLTQLKSDIAGSSMEFTQTNQQGYYELDRETEYILVEKMGFVNQLKQVSQLNYGAYLQQLQVDFELEKQVDNTGGDPMEVIDDILPISNNRIWNFIAGKPLISVLGALGIIYLLKKKDK